MLNNGGVPEDGGAFGNVDTLHHDVLSRLAGSIDYKALFCTQYQEKKKMMIFRKLGARERLPGHLVRIGG